MATTTNFGWTTPDNTDLVKNGALAIRTLGSAIDTSLVSLKGGTTSQVLSKGSGTDLDFTWTTPGSGQTLLSTTTLSGASTTITVAGGYNDLKVIVYGSTCASNGYLIFKPNNSSSLAYYYTAYQNGASNAGPEYKNGSTWDLNQGYTLLANDANNVNEIYITNYASTSTLKPARSHGMHIGASSQNVSYFATGAIKTSSAITSLVFNNSGGNFTGGTVLVYGVK
jgi:hypothetical protein